MFASHDNKPERTALYKDANDVLDKGTTELLDEIIDTATSETPTSVTSPISQTTSTQSSLFGSAATGDVDPMFLPDYLGGLIPTQQGYLNYVAEKLREAESHQRSLTCPHCQRMMGNAGAYKRHVGSCKKRPEALVIMKEKCTCDQCTAFPLVE